MMLSAEAMFSNANSLALADRLFPCAAAANRAIRFHVIVEASTQKFATCVCSGVRSVLLIDPSRLISLKSCVYASLVKAGGGSGRNCEALRIVKGRTFPQATKLAGKKEGGVG